MSSPPDGIKMVFPASEAMNVDLYLGISDCGTWIEASWMAGEGSNQPLATILTSNVGPALLVQAVFPSSLSNITARFFLDDMLVAFPPFPIICRGTRAGPLSIDFSNPQAPLVDFLGAGYLSSATSVTGPWIVLKNATTPYPFTLDVPQRYFRVIDLWRKCCRHKLEFYNNAALHNVKKIRILAGNASTEIVYAAVSSPYLQSSAYPDHVDWVLPTGGTFPDDRPGGLIPGSFQVWILGNGHTDKCLKAQWLDGNGEILCEQVVAAPCPKDQDVPDTGVLQTLLDPACSCVGTTLAFWSHRGRTSTNSTIRVFQQEP